MQIIPVLDMMGGRVVRGVAGRRSEYRPVVGLLTASCQPLGVARAFRRLGLTTLYVADLDAIGGAEPALGTFADLMRDGFRLWIDAGVRRMDRVHMLADAGVEGIVIGLETAGPDVLAEACVALGPRVLFSLDLKGGKPLGDAEVWRAAEARAVAAKAVGLGARRLIVLDLARVGVGGGTGTEELCAALAAAHPDVEIIAGGGVRGPDDLRRLAACGVQAALVASALHDGRLTRADWERL